MHSEITSVLIVCTCPLLVLMVGLWNFVYTDRPLEKRFAILACASVLTTICEGFCSIVVFWGEETIALPVYIVIGAVFSISALIGFISICRLSAETQRQKEYLEFKSICITKKCDNGVEILRIKDGGMTPEPDVITHLPDGMEVYCTMGLWELYHHCDLSIMLKLAPGLAETILTELVHRIEGGEKFEHGQFIDGLAQTTVQLVQDAPGDKESPLRIIFPDANGYWPGDRNCDPVIAQQTLPGNQIWSFHEKDNREEEK